MGHTFYKCDAAQLVNSLILELKNKHELYFEYFQPYIVIYKNILQSANLLILEQR